MTAEVLSLNENSSLLEASLKLEKISHTGAPVLSDVGLVTGFLTLRDIMKGRRGGQMHAPVKGYMTKKLITAKTDSTVREIDDLMFENNIGHLPIIDDKKLCGIVTRNDYLNFKRGERKKKKRAYEKMGLAAGSV
jgi:tRNA nucleotidyltransferase (CCA-adding enzyme)